MVYKGHHEISILVVPIFTVGDEGAVRSTCPLGEEDEEEERWKFSSFLTLPL